MSDFLQFVDRIPTLPNRKKLTFENDGSIKYVTMEYADEPITPGTIINKSNLSKVNSILGFNKLENGVIESVTELREIDSILTTNYPVNQLSTGNAQQVGSIQLGSNFTVNLTADVITEYLQLNSSNQSASESQTHFLQKNVNDYASSTNPNGAGILTRKNSTGHSIIYLDKKIKLKSYKTVNSSMSGGSYLDSMTIKFYNDDELVESMTTSTYQPTVHQLPDYIEINKIDFTASNKSSSYSIITQLQLNEFEILDTYNVKNYTLQNNEFIDNQLLYVSLEEEKDASIEKIKINGIDAGDLIYKDKTKLFYNETKNKFEGLPSRKIFDITINQSVNEILIPGLAEKLEAGKLYYLYIKAKSTSTANYQYLYFGDTTIGYTPTSAAEPILTTYMIGVYELDGIKYISTYESSTSFRNTSGKLTGYETIKNSSGNFESGSRFILKEVA